MIRYNPQAYGANLTQAEWDVIALYYGLGHEEPHSYKKISNIFLTTQADIRRLRISAELRLRATFGEQVIIDLKRHRRKQL
jgi:DNA-directed RNA polymerase sigma subunit (sigma70/sigma32)